MGKSKGAVAITNYDEVIAAKIKTCHNNFRSGGFDPWRAAISILVEAVALIEVAVVLRFGSRATDQSDDSSRRVVG